jgi:hypothetical protein
VEREINGFEDRGILILRADLKMVIYERKAEKAK